MLSGQGNYFLLSTAHTSMLLFCADGRAEYRYFGELVRDTAGAELLAPEWEGRTLLPCSPWGSTDFREPSLLIRHADGSVASRFVLTGAEIAPRVLPAGLPHACGGGDCLRLTYRDEAAKLVLCLQLMPLEACDAIVSSAWLKNEGEYAVEIERIASLQLELWGKDFSFTTFDGAWGSERQRHTRPLALGKCENASYAGSSSAFHNPFVMLTRPGETYACNLIYSGNHRETAEADDTGRTRLIAGINPFGFSWRVEPGETFYTPEAVLVYAQSPAEASARMRNFVMTHIIPPRWADCERPVLVNNWEGTYFSFTRDKILSIAARARDVGAELFVLDDGWFGKRDSDTCSLGDWQDNAAKTGGLAQLGEKVRAMGLEFGIWMEPEMINEDSDLYRAHPGYAMKVPGRTPVRQRHQLMLNLADERVQNFVVRAVSDVLTRSGATYLKWDFNRHMSDCYGKGVPAGEYFHRYMLGFYRVAAKLAKRFPGVLFEGCAGGGGRFDLGILCYFPQIWASDDTDARMRTDIQRGTSYAYPQSSIGAHVSACPNHQTGDDNTLAARFNVACGGVLGYELDPTKLSEEERAAIARQIAFYKEHRKTLQFGKQYRLCGEGLEGYIAVSKDEASAVAVVNALNVLPGQPDLFVRFKGLNPSCVYEVTRADPAAADGETFSAGGDLLMHGCLPLHGLWEEKLAQHCSGGIVSRMYLFKKTKQRS